VPITLGALSARRGPARAGRTAASAASAATTREIIRLRENVDTSEAAREKAERREKHVRDTLLRVLDELLLLKEGGDDERK